MKKVFVFFTVAVCLYLASAAQATLVEANNDWGINQISGISQLSCIVHHIPDIASSLVFTEGPAFINGDPSYPDDFSQWQTELSLDKKTICLLGPVTSDYRFKYTLFYQWDDAVANPDYPVYIDTAIFNGSEGTLSLKEWSWRGNPAEILSWEYQDHSYNSGEPYTSPHDPLPEPITILVLGLGAVLLGKTKNQKSKLRS